MKYFLIAPPSDCLFEEPEQRRLRRVAAEGRDLGVDAFLAEFENGGSGGLRYRLAVGHGEQRGGVIQLLRNVRLQSRFQLVGESVGASRPVKGHGGKDGNHGVVGMGGDRALAAKSHYHLRTYLADPPGQIGDGCMKILTVEFAVGIIQHLGVVDLQRPAGVRELPAAYLLQLIVGFCASPVGGSMTRRETQHKGFHAQFRVVHQRAAKTAGLIVGMRGYTEETKHVGRSVLCILYLVVSIWYLCPSERSISHIVKNLTTDRH